MSPWKAQAWHDLLTDPRLKQCLEQARDYREKIAYEVLRRAYPSLPPIVATGHSAPERPTSAGLDNSLDKTP